MSRYTLFCTQSEAFLCVLTNQGNRPVSFAERVTVRNAIRKCCILLLIGIVLFLAGCPGGGSRVPPSAASAPADDAPLAHLYAPLDALRARFSSLAPLQEPMGSVRPGEWQAFWNEPEESPRRYVVGMPNVQSPTRRTLDILPVGAFTPAQERILEETVRYVEVYFNTAVQRLPTRPASQLPMEARHTVRGQATRLHASYMVDTYLKPLRREESWGIMAVTALDLHAGSGREGIYGETLLYGRTGIFSMARFGDPDKDAQTYRTVLARTLKCATHEIGHLLSLRHCKTYRCTMNGRIGLEEFDVAPTSMCPDCLTKLGFAMEDIDPVSRFRRLAPLAREFRLARDADYFERAARTLADTAAPPALPE